MIRCEFQALLVRSNTTRCRVPVQVELRYDRADPYAFCVVFSNAIEEFTSWLVSRDLLVEAMECQTRTGDGDVKFRRDDLSGRLRVCLRSPDGHADVEFPIQPVEAFLEESREEAVEAEEQVTAMVDEALKEFFGGR